MKRILYLNYFILLINIFNITNINANNNKQNDVDSILISKIEIGEMEHKYLSDYNLIWKRAIWNYGREYVYKSNNNAGAIHITIGLHPSKEDAIKIASDYINGISIKMTEGKYNGLQIGERYWWYETDSNLNKLTNIVFVRKNALFILSCSQRIEYLELLAKKIDDDIKNKENYLYFSDSIEFPKIKSVILNEHETTNYIISTVKIEAEDSIIETLEYQFSPGIPKYKKDSKNEFVISKYKKGSKPSASYIL